MDVVAGWALAGGLVVWISSVLWAAGVPKGSRAWLKKPKNASKALRWLTWVLAGVFAGAAWLAWASDPTSELGGFRTEATGIAVAVIVIEEISRARAYLDNKQSVIQQMRSQSHDFALDAVRIARDEGWLRNGSLRDIVLWGAKLQYADLHEADLHGARMVGADLQSANLQKADLQRSGLWWADLRAAYLNGANLQDAVLVGAKLQGTNLKDADLQGALLKIQDPKPHVAHLKGAHLKGANLQSANLQGTRYNNKTIWPDGFTPPADAINVDELNDTPTPSSNS